MDPYHPLVKDGTLTLTHTIGPQWGGVESLSHAKVVVYQCPNNEFGANYLLLCSTTVLGRLNVVR